MACTRHGHDALGDMCRPRSVPPTVKGTATNNQSRTSERAAVVGMLCVPYAMEIPFNENKIPNETTGITDEVKSIAFFQPGESR